MLPHRFHIMTNREICRQIVAQIEQHETRLLYEFLVGKTAPISVFSNSGNAGVVEWTVTGLTLTLVNRYAPDRPTNADVARLRGALATALAFTVADPMNICIHSQKDKTSKGTPWQRLFDHSYGDFESRELAVAANKKWHEDHDPRPDHFACAYCGKQTPNIQKVTRTIYVNRGQQIRDFCSGQCATHDQFASEG